jgi:hypothetical protein
MAIEENPFNSEFFLWADAGISRFFLDVDISCEYPGYNGNKILEQTKDKFIIQKRNDLYSYQLNDDFIWNSANLLSGGMFGGSAMIVTKIAKLVEQVFIEKMLNKNNVNNEQLALALVWNSHKDMFHLVDNYLNFHLCLFKYLS